MRQQIRILGIAACAFLFGATSFGQAASKTFTQADLEKMVSELTVYLPQDPRLAYPVKCVVEQNDDVNANASAQYPAGAKKEGAPTAVMTVYTGLFKWMNNDINLVRAVVAHELAHLSKRHLGSGMKVADLGLVLTRQQEYEADRFGAVVLEKAGYSRKHMVSMLLRLGEVAREAPASVKVMGDHADCQRRASAVDKDSLVLKSMVSFTNGEAYMDVRAYNQAMTQFDLAVQQAPGFYEAQYNSALAASLVYYELLDPLFKADWFQPDFGPSLLLPKQAVTGKGKAVNPQDVARFNEALVKIRALLNLDPNRQESLELLGVTLVLDPNAAQANIQEGIRVLEKALSTSVIGDSRLRIANNLALGFQRQGNVSTAIERMFGEQKKTQRFNPFLAANLGAQPLPAKIKGADAQLAANVLYTYLNGTNANAVGYKKVEANFQALLKKFNLKSKEVKRVGIPLCTAFSLTDGGKTIFLLEPFKNAFSKFGKIETIHKYSSEYTGIIQFGWQGGNLTIITDKKFSDETPSPAKLDEAFIDSLEVIRVTSYNPGAYVDLKSADSQVNASFRIKVGMTTEEFEKILSLEMGEPRELIHNAAMETWTYFQGLNFGVYVKDKKIAGVTVCPVE